MRKLYNVDGKDYTVKELSVKFNMRYGTLLERLTSGCTLEEALKPVMRSSKVTPKPLLYKGKPFRSINNLCLTLKISRTSFTNLITNGYSVEDAVARLLSLAENGVNPVFVDDIPFKSVADVARNYGVSDTSVSRYIVGNKISSEVLYAIKERANTKVEYMGEEYDTLLDLVTKLGLSYNSVKSRLVYGWSLAEALTDDNARNKAVEYLGVSYPTHKALAQAFNLDYNVFMHRLTKGWSIAEAVTNTGDKRFVEITYKGVDYPSKKAFCDAFNIDFNAFKYRLKRGWSLDTIVSTPVKKRNK